MQVLHYLVSFFVIGVLFIIYQFIVKPKRLYNWYCENFQKLGYKAYKYPFTVLEVPMITMINEDTKKGDAFYTLKKEYPKYDLTISNMISGIIIEVNSSELIQAFYEPDKHYEFPKTQFHTGVFRNTIGTGLVFSEGQQWKKKRKILTSVFNFDFLKGLTGKIVRICDSQINEEEMRYYERVPENKGKGFVQYQILNLMSNIFSNVIIECFFSHSQNQQINGEPVASFLNKLIQNLGQQTFDPLYLLFGKSFLDSGLRKKDRDVSRRVVLFQEWCMRTIKKRITQIEENKDNRNNDLLEAIIMNGKDKKYTQEQLMEEFSIFFVAGTETTSHFVLMMIYYIAQNPEVQEKLRSQIKEFMSEDDYSYQNLKKFKYIQCIQKETTRIYGPANGLFVRQATKDTYLKDIPIKKGTKISIRSTPNHYSQKYFENPTQFKPERWEKELVLPPYIFAGFSAGARTCIGKHLAFLQSKVALIKFMKRYKEIILPDKEIKMRIKLTYAPESFETKLILN